MLLGFALLVRVRIIDFTTAMPGEEILQSYDLDEINFQVTFETQLGEFPVGGFYFRDGYRLGVTPLGGSYQASTSRTTRREN